MRASLVLILALSGCSTGLTPLTEPGEQDTGIDVGGPDDTGPGDPIDTGDTAGNLAPLADAGPDQTLATGVVVQLDGSASADPDGDPLSYAWEFTSLPTESNTNLLDADQADARFYADAPGTYALRLTVDDGLATSWDDVEIVAEQPNEIPVADAGADQSISVGGTAQLNGSASYDPDGDPLTFQWSLTSTPSGSGAGLDDPTSELPRITADVAGTYVAELIVNDGAADSAPDQVRVVAQSQDDGDCLSCTAAVRREVRHRMTVGDAASGPGLVLLPLLVLFWQRKRDLG